MSERHAWPATSAWRLRSRSSSARATSGLDRSPGRSDFALYLVRRDGRGVERLTYAEPFASFPMFSPDGRRLVFCPSRGAAAPREFNVFVADWME